LTGSEKRGSGWCVLDGQTAETLTVHTDQEMIDRIFDLKPDLVSIDSPLLASVRGARSSRMTTPAVKSLEIMRKCERELKRRGVKRVPSAPPEHASADRAGACCWLPGFGQKGSP